MVADDPTHITQSVSELPILTASNLCGAKKAGILYITTHWNMKLFSTYC